METTRTRMSRTLCLHAIVAVGNASPTCVSMRSTMTRKPQRNRTTRAQAVIASFVLLVHALVALELARHTPQPVLRDREYPLNIDVAFTSAPVRTLSSAPEPLKRPEPQASAHISRPATPHAPRAPKQSVQPFHASRPTQSVSETASLTDTQTRTTTEPAPTQRAEAPAEPVPQAVTPASFDAAYLHNPAPDYPPQALERGWRGNVLLRAHVLSTGRADRVDVVASSGHEMLDEAAIEAVSNWRFVPARRGESAIDAWVRVPVNFEQ